MNEHYIPGIERHQHHGDVVLDVNNIGAQSHSLASRPHPTDHAYTDYQKQVTDALPGRATDWGADRKVHLTTKNVAGFDLTDHREWEMLLAIPIALLSLAGILTYLYGPTRARDPLDAMEAGFGRLNLT